ncbi:hypothetical protein A2966_02665 [Candidatus Roizmanbacteria bacterium RIFCSPLOWO2_01_FULL_41_22]|uniref:UvrD-like helicase C-terminal domain-containing protein n=1 Tax=Candidatus Roizmanbacteria bacterium RIFCSPLOWO2_01_FULL_41_22 TaxID=1802067 RepID=A0A1F7JA02_9BACT|nr:MAG: hypothetical protein A2966_02665 [Candidatus Roizmanbacteria bacterium RIFCSPLOWO2_01_FULL_41_22]
MFELSGDQKQALATLINWFQKEKTRKQYITLGGYAGTGKTTLIGIFRKQLDQLDKKLKVGFASYTGKAARVLQDALHQQKAVFRQDTVGTIHSLIYSPIVNEREEIVGWQKKEKIDRQLIIIDEGSMVDGQIWQHLLSYHLPVVVVGDHGQLPPINGNFYLLQEPDLQLQEIHRQARKNPIIGLSIQAREQGLIRSGNYSDSVRKFSQGDPDGQETMQELLSSFTPDTLVLCGYNNTRRKLNHFMRAALGFETAGPTNGDRVICLRNNHQQDIYNGMLGTIIGIESSEEGWYLAEIAMDGQEKPFKGLISARQFDSETPLNFTDKRSQIMRGDLFDFGYALTVHKAQGSQAKRVVLFEQRFKKMTELDWRRWLYTAVTRAQTELFIFP